MTKQERDSVIDEVLELIGTEPSMLPHDLLVWHHNDEVAREAGNIDVLDEQATFNKLREAIQRLKDGRTSLTNGPDAAAIAAGDAGGAR
jgi:hypothetical protein